MFRLLTFTLGVVSAENAVARLDQLDAEINHTTPTADNVAFIQEKKLGYQLKCPPGQPCNCNCHCNKGSVPAAPAPMMMPNPAAAPPPPAVEPPPPAPPPPPPPPPPAAPPPPPPPPPPPLPALPPMPAISAADLPTLAPLPIAFPGSFFGSGSGSGSMMGSGSGSGSAAAPPAALVSERNFLKRSAPQTSAATPQSIEQQLAQQSAMLAQEEREIASMKPVLALGENSNNAVTSTAPTMQATLQQPQGYTPATPQMMMPGSSPQWNPQMMMAMGQQQFLGQQPLYSPYYGFNAAPQMGQMPPQMQYGAQYGAMPMAQYAPAQQMSAAPALRAVLRTKKPLSFLQERAQERFCYCPCMFGK